MRVLTGATPNDDISDGDLAELYAVPADRPFLRVNMVSTVDGSATGEDARTRSINNAADKRVFQVLRSLADVVIVGAGTVRVERYGPVKLRGELIEARRARGQTELPPIAIVTRSCQLDWSSPLFTETTTRPIVITVTEAVDGAAHAQGVADVIIAGERDVDLPTAMSALRQRGAAAVVCEGGPQLNGLLGAAGVIDEL